MHKVSCIIQCVANHETFVMFMSTHDRKNRYVTYNMQPQVTSPLIVEKEFEADNGSVMKKKEGAEEKKRKMESVLNEETIASGQEMAAVDIEMEKEGVKVDMGTNNEANKEDAHDDPSNTGNHDYCVPTILLFLL